MMSKKWIGFLLFFAMILGLGSLAGCHERRGRDVVVVDDRPRRPEVVVVEPRGHRPPPPRTVIVEPRGHRPPRHETVIVKEGHPHKDVVVVKKPPKHETIVVKEDKHGRVKEVKVKKH